jgi:hypothetical protein
MNLKEYIVEAITSIKEATKQIDNNLLQSGIRPPDGEEFYNSRTSVSTVSFDIATTVAEVSNSGTSSNASAKIQIVGFKIGGDATQNHQSNTTSEHISRIKFDISMNY